jgi:hypothetical protein
MQVEDAKPGSAADLCATKSCTISGSPPLLDPIHPVLGLDEHTASLAPSNSILQHNPRLLADVTGIWRRMQGK